MMDIENIFKCIVLFKKNCKQFVNIIYPRRLKSLTREIVEREREKGTKKKERE